MGVFFIGAEKIRLRPSFCGVFLRRYAESFDVQAVKRRIIVEAALIVSLGGRHSALNEVAGGNQTFSGYVFPKRRAGGFAEMAVELRYADVKHICKHGYVHFVEKMVVYKIGYLRCEVFLTRRSGGMGFFAERGVDFAQQRREVSKYPQTVVFGPVGMHHVQQFERRNFQFGSVVQVFLAQPAFEKRRKQFSLGVYGVKNIGAEIQRIAFVIVAVDNCYTVRFHGTHQDKLVGEQFIGGGFDHAHGGAFDKIQNFALVVYVHIKRFVVGIFIGDMPVHQGFVGIKIVIARYGHKHFPPL